MACITEEGRILEFFEDPNIRTLELVNGVWRKPLKPVSADEEFHARVLSEEELAQYMEKSGKSN